MERFQVPINLRVDGTGAAARSSRATERSERHVSGADRRARRAAGDRLHRGRRDRRVPGGLTSLARLQRRMQLAVGGAASSSRVLRMLALTGTHEICQRPIMLFASPDAYMTTAIACAVAGGSPAANPRQPPRLG